MSAATNICGIPLVAILRGFKWILPIFYFHIIFFYLNLCCPSPASDNFRRWIFIICDLIDNFRTFSQTSTQRNIRRVHQITAPVYTLTVVRRYTFTDTLNNLSTFKQDTTQNSEPPEWDMTHTLIAHVLSHFLSNV